MKVILNILVGVGVLLGSVATVAQEDRWLRLMQVSRKLASSGTVR